MSEDQQQFVMYTMYRALVNSPCGCCYRWASQGAVQEVVTVCQRCRAMRLYEALQLDGAAAPEVVT